MKPNIHPTMNPVVFVDSSAGTEFMTRSTLSSEESRDIDGVSHFVIRVDVSSASHPFYTGKQVLLDTARRVEKFEARAAKQAAAAEARKGKKAKAAARAAAQAAEDAAKDPVKKKKKDDAVVAEEKTEEAAPAVEEAPVEETSAPEANEEPTPEAPAAEEAAPETSEEPNAEATEEEKAEA